MFVFPRVVETRLVVIVLDVNLPWLQGVFAVDQPIAVRRHALSYAPHFIKRTLFDAVRVLLARRSQLLHEDLRFYTQTIVSL